MIFKSLLLFFLLKFGFRALSWRLSITLRHLRQLLRRGVAWQSKSGRFIKYYTNSNRQLDQRIHTEAWSKHAQPEIETVINLCSDSFDWVQTGKDLGLGLQAHCKNRCRLSKYMKQCHAIVIKEEKLETASLQQALSSPSHSIPKCSWRSDFYLCLSQLCDQSIHLSSSALSPTWMNKYTQSKMTARFPDESHEIVPAGGRQGGVVCLSVYWGTVH